MTKHDKLVSLKRIRDEVIDKIYKERWEEVWFFPEYKQVPGVKGFLGTDPIFFLSINPSFGTFPSDPDIFYYRNLKRQGFGNAHLTDFFKVKCKNKNSKELSQNKSLVKECKQILKKEIKALSPKLIVGVGISYRKFYRQNLSGYGIPLCLIPHYAPQFNNSEKKKRFRRKLRGLANFTKNCSSSFLLLTPTKLLTKPRAPDQVRFDLLHGYALSPAPRF